MVVTAMKSKYLKRPQLERGQSLVEVAISLSFLMILLSGLLDLGRLWYIYLALEDAAGEAALYLSLDPFCIDEDDVRPDSSVCSDPNNGLFRAKYSVEQDIIDWSKVETIIKIEGVPVNLSSPPLITVGNEITVEIHYPLGLLTPLMPRIAGLNPIILRTQATQRVIRAYRDE
jgi:hypothetical protein